MIRSSVDFPQPEAPSRQMNWPFFTVRWMPRKASTGPLAASYTLCRSPICRIGTGGREGSGMMPRTPAQEIIAQQEKNAIGQESCQADDNHAGYDEVGARQSA